jgi:23S rRNA pseudouridine1911/1915/1917 synthase
MTDQPRSIEVPETLDGTRFDSALAQLFPEFSRSRLKTWVLDGCATLDGAKVAPRQSVKTGQLVTLLASPDEVTAAAPEAMPLSFAYEDEYLLVLNKPVGLVVHPGAGNPTGTLVNGLLAFDPTLAQLPRAGLIHRLDKDTSGLLMIARTLEAHTQLVRALEAREIAREYRAICLGRLTAGGMVDEPIGRHPTQRTKMSVHHSGKAAVTHYRVLTRFDNFTFIACRLESGRTHQIRVHMAYRKHPLVGDPLYSGRLVLPAGSSEELQLMLRGFKRQALHASRLAFAHPITGAPIELQSELPDDFQALLQIMSKGSFSAAEFNAMAWPEVQER